MLFGGALARHPDLTVLLEEVHAGWFPYFVGNLGRMAWSIPALGDWPWDTSGAAMLERAVRITPLPGFGDLDALEVLEAAPGQCVFSSDDPHMEGNADLIARYGPALDELDPALRAAFLGGTMADAFARTGNPLPAVA